MPSETSNHAMLPPPVSPEQMAEGLTQANLDTAITVRSMPEERRVLEARYRCRCGEPLTKVADHMVQLEERHLHLLAFQCPSCGAQGGIIFDITAAVALLPSDQESEKATPEEERRAAELATYYLLDKAPAARSEAAINTLSAGIRALGPAAIGALRYSLRDVDPQVVGIAARALAAIGDATDVRRLRAAIATTPNAPYLQDALASLEARVRQLAREADEVWRPAASL